MHHDSNRSGGRTHQQALMLHSVGPSIWQRSWTRRRSRGKLSRLLLISKYLAEDDESKQKAAALHRRSQDRLTAHLAPLHGLFNKHLETDSQRRGHLGLTERNRSKNKCSFWRFGVPVPEEPERMEKSERLWDSGEANFPEHPSKSVLGQGPLFHDLVRRKVKEKENHGFNSNSVKEQHHRVSLHCVHSIKPAALQP